MDNLVALSYLVKNVWGVGGKGRGNLELSHIKRDHPYCRAPTRNFECGGRLLVQKCEGLKPMDVEQGNVSKPLLKPRQTRDISLCTESVETPKKNTYLGKQTHQHVEGCISNKLVPRFELRFSPIHFNSQSSGKSPKGESILDLVESCLANHKIASKVARNEHSKPDYSSKLPRFIKESKKGGSSTVTKPVFKIRCMKSFREKLS